MHNSLLFNPSIVRSHSTLSRADGLCGGSLGGDISSEVPPMSTKCQMWVVDKISNNH